MALVEMYMNSRVIPALVKIGIVPADYIFEWEIDEDLEDLWKKVVDASSMGFEVDADWIKTKFKIEITGKKKEPEISEPIEISDNETKIPKKEK